MNKSYVILFFCSFFFSIGFSDVFAQITIGKDGVPVTGALLDIKQIDPTDPQTNNITSEKGGLVYPRVLLQDLTSLQPLVSATDDGDMALKKEHVGLMVYNLTSDKSKNLVIGEYVWNGTIWKKLYEATGKFSLQFTPNTSTLIFPSGRSVEPLVTQNLQIDWEPAIIPCSLVLNPLVNNGVIGFTPPAQTDKSGTLLLPITLDPIPQNLIDEDPFYERSSVLTVLNVSEQGEVNTSSLLIKQINYALLVKGFKPYMILGRTYKINIASNTDWTVSITDNDNVIESHNIPVSNSNANSDGDNYLLTLKNQLTLEGKKFSLTFTSPNNKFATQTIDVEITPEYPNSYIVIPGTSIDIPVKKAYTSWLNELKENIPDTPLTAELVWQDEQNLISNVSSVTGSGINAKFSVTTTNTVGNATVALKINGTIYWSWHLWVINYDPESAVPNSSGATPVTGGNLYSYNNGQYTSIFMDRNLGAKSIALNDYKAQGVQYQWGRKDPFQGQNSFAAGGLDVYPGITIYDASNTALTYGTPTGGTGFNFVSIPNATGLNVINAINNPMNYYIGSPTNDGDWYSNELGVHNTELWLDYNTHKTDYDPCPKGWRVPYSAYDGDFASPWQGLPLTPIVQFNVDWTPEGAGLYPQVVGRSTSGTFITSVPVRQSTANSIVKGLTNSIASAGSAYIIPINGTYASSVPIRCAKDK